MYGGLWGILSQWFRVPRQPPALPVLPGEQLQAFKPSDGFLRYLKLKFWIALAVIDGLIVLGWLSLTRANPWIGAWLAPLALVIAVVPDIVAYLAIHLQYDTTWYVLSRRSLRIRSGIWTIHEATITFENVQNVTVESGPIERCFGIANVIVHTAGGGSKGEEGPGKGKGDFHRGAVAGVSNAAEIRQLILNRLSESRAAGLGDEERVGAAPGPGWTADHVKVLREIRDTLSG